MQWFNENHPWDIVLNGNDIERLALIQAKYPSIFEINRWTGLIEIRNASYQKTTNSSMLIENYTKIDDGFVCHAINGKQCMDYEIGFCLESNVCSVPMTAPDETYIVGGTTVRPSSFPWHVSIQYEEKHICSGTLIDDQHILTAASCVQTSLTPIPYSVVLGTHDLSNITLRVSVKSIKLYEDYNINTTENDISFIRLNERIQLFSENIRPICLTRSTVQVNMSNPFIVTGWRIINNENGSIQYTDELRQTILTVMYQCSRVYQKYDFKKQLCLGRDESKFDLCQGDKGSGLFQKQTYDIDRWILTGIVSHGCEYASQGYLDVHTRISAYYDWIQTTIEQMNKDNGTK